MPIQKAVAMIDVALHQDAVKIKLKMLYAVHFLEEAWQLTTPTTIKNCFVNCGFWIDHVSCCETVKVRG
jgi:hypothetical protein